MIAAAKKPSILLVDDKADLLEKLRKDLTDVLGDVADVRSWVPVAADDPLTKFESLVDSETVLVVTDHDLTIGKMGLYGSTIVAWCQGKSIPVGDFSRGKPKSLPSEPNLFELRVPIDGTAPSFIADAFRGFKSILDSFRGDAALQKKRSPASALATLLGKPSLEPSFALYMSRQAVTNSSLLQSFLDKAPKQIQPSADERARLLAYVVGHFLLNAILRYPGPILSERALAAYLAIAESGLPQVLPTFAGSDYAGPFGQTQRYFWRDVVDGKLAGLHDALGTEAFDTSGEMNRRALELKLNIQLPRFECDRCAGRNGGLFCPFTKRTVCSLANCSVAAASWVPPGAQVCRVERDFYDEWAPLLGV